MKKAKSFVRAIGALIIREMITRYGRSWGGYIWAVLEPVAFIVILSLAFSQIVRTPAIGSSFVFFYATGYVPFHFFLETASNTGNSIAVNRPLLRLPLITALDVVLARFLLSILTLTVVAGVIYVGILMLLDEAFKLSFNHLFLSAISAAVLGLGVGSINASLFEFVPVWRQIWGIISRPLFIISGVLFLFQELPVALREILWWNPLIHVTGQNRLGFYPNYEGNYVVIIYPLLLGTAMTVIGFALLIRHRSRLTEVQ